MKRRQAHAPRLDGGAVAPRQGQGRQMPDPPPVAALQPDHFAAPSAAVRPIAMPVQRHAQQGTTGPMLGRHRRHMGQMVLHGKDRQAETFGKAAGDQIGMQVADDGFRFHPGQIQHMANGFMQKGHGGGIVHTAHMLRDERFAPARHRHRHFQMGPNRQHGRAVLAQIDGVGNESPRPPQNDRSRCLHRHHRIVGAGDDGTVVTDDHIGDAGQGLQGLGVVDHQRIAADIGAGRHQNRHVTKSDKALKYKMVKWRISQNNADLGQPWGNAIRQFAPRCHQDDGAGAVGQKVGFDRPHLGNDSGRSQIRHHNCECLCRTVLALAQPLHRVLVKSVAHQMIAADALDRDDPALLQMVYNLINGMGQLRSAHRTGQRFGMIAARSDVVVIALTVGTQRKVRQRRLRTVIGQGSGDGKTRPAMGAGDERIAVKPAGRVGHIRQTIGTGGGIGGNAGVDSAARAGQNGKAALTGGGHFHHVHPIDPGQGRCVLLQIMNEGVGVVALHLHHHPVAVIEDETRQIQTLGKSMHIGAKAHPLHRPPHPQPQSPGRGDGKARRVGHDYRTAAAKARVAIQS